MSESPRTSLPARWFLGSVGVFLIILGLSFTWWLYGAGQRAMITRKWTEVPCTILASGIREGQFSPNSPITWTTELEYRYLWEGQVYHGTKIKRIEGPTPHRSRATAAAAAFPPGAVVTCYVNPAQPSEAVLQHATKAAFYNLWWPLLFAAGGTGMLAAALRRNPKKPPPETPAPTIRTLPAQAPQPDLPRQPDSP